MRQIILHIGSHKTGTTALQSWIETNRAVLAQGGLADLFTPGDFNAHKWLTFDDPAAIFPAGYRLGDPEAFARDILALQAERVLVSSENFAFFFREAAIAELAATLKPLCDDIVVLAYIRRQDRHAVSHHMEGARADRPPEWQLWGHGLRALPEPNPLQPLYLDYDRRLSMWQRHFGADAVKVRVFDRRYLVDGDIVADFTQVLGIDRKGCTDSKDVNTSLDRVKTRMGHMANVIAGRDRLTRTLLISTRNTDQALRPTKDEAQAFLEPYRASNAVLNARLRLTDHPDLFPDDFDDLPDQAQSGWSDEDFTRAIRGAVTAMARLTDDKAVPSFADLREAALALSTKAPHRALRLVEAALVQRPRSKVMWAMQAELAAYIKTNRGTQLTDYSDVDED